MKVDELINKLQNPLNKLLINENVLNVKATELSNELLETLKIIENCTSCKDNKIDGNDLDKIEKCLTELKKEQRWDIFNKLNDELFKINIRLNKEILCEGCKGKRIEKLTDKCGNKEIARFLLMNIYSATVPDRMHHCDLGLFSYQVNFTKDYIRLYCGKKVL